MKRFILVFSFVALLTVLRTATAFAWNVAYEGDVMPNDPSLGVNIWNEGLLCDYSLSSSQDGMLHIVEPWTNKRAYFVREESIPAGTPMTVEARFRIASANTGTIWMGSAVLGMWNPDHGVEVKLSPGFMVIGANPGAVRLVDLSMFHTVRMAMNSDKTIRVWLDGTEIVNGQTSRGPGVRGIWFGTPPYTNGPGAYTSTVDMYWDYVRYSTEYLPVPEPSALMTLAGGLGALALPLMRRKREP